MVTAKDGYLLVDVKASPRSPKEKLENREGEILARIHAAPVEGEANAAVIALFAKALGIPKKAVSIYRGETSRQKVIRVDGVSEAEFFSKIADS